MQFSPAFSIPATVLFLASPLTAFAHEHRIVTVGDTQYNITVGSLNEPMYVDDKTAVELIVSNLSADKKNVTTSDDGPKGTPVEGLAKDLKVELRAGDQKKVLEFTPEDGTPGSYEAVFYPTVQTTYSYRVFGTLNKEPIDLTYTCSPAATADVPEDTTSVKLSDHVTQTLKGGAFGCPEAKADAQFPTTGAPIADLTSRVQVLETPKTSMDTGMIGIVVGAIGIVIGLGAWIVKKK